MATNLDFSRAVVLNITHSNARKFDAVIVLARSDAGAVNFSTDALKFDIYKDNWSTTATVAWVAVTNFTVSTATLTFDATPSGLGVGTHKYILYNSTNNQAIATGDFNIVNIV